VLAAGAVGAMLAAGPGRGGPIRFFFTSTWTVLVRPCGKLWRTCPASPPVGARNSSRVPGLARPSRFLMSWSLLSVIVGPIG
jgi:hypothetical protein